MPTHTPSPRRFLAPNVTPNQTQTSKKPPSKLRHEHPARNPPHGLVHETERSVHSTPKATPAKRFVVKPRQREEASGPSTQQYGTPHPRPRREFARVESIDDGSQVSAQSTQHQEFDAMEVVPSIEQSQMFSQMFSQEEEDGDGDDDENDNEEILFTTEDPRKRRKLSPDPPSSPSQLALRNIQPQPPLPTSKPPTTTTTSSSSHRFLPPPPKPPITFPHIPPSTNPTPFPPPTTTPTPAQTRPPFLRPAPPSPSTLTPQTPLPTTFSPSRKGQKFIPGGLASTLQTWIIEAASTSHAPQTRGNAMGGAGKREDGVVVRIRVRELGRSEEGEREGGRRVVECVPGGIVLLRGDTDAGLYNASRMAQGSQGRVGGSLNVLLAGRGGARGAGPVTLALGDVVGIRGPTWEVEVRGEMWVVGVEWGVL